MPGVGINVAITGDVSGLNSAVGEAKTGLGGLGGAMNALPMIAVAGAALGVGAAIVGMTKAAEEDLVAQEKLNKIYDQATGTVGDYSGEIDAAIKKGAEKAFSDDEVRAGLESLIIATGSADDANEELAVAMDLARFANVDLETASDALAKAHQGQTGALAKLVPGLDKTKTKTDQIADATKLAQGQADLYAESAEGMAKKGGDAFGELGEEIGGAFLPIMKELLPLIDPVVDLLSELVKAVLPLLGPAVKIIVIAIKALVEVLKAVIEGIKTVMGWIGDLVDKFKSAADLVGSIDLNPFSASSGGSAFAAEEMGRSGRAGRSGGGGGGTTVNVQMMSADPEQVVRAIRRWSRNNGGSGPFTRGLDRSTA